MDDLSIQSMVSFRAQAGLLFEDIARTSTQFHPHPLTPEFASSHTWVNDVYVVALLDDQAIAYGMLRGWDAGYIVPSLGVAVASAHRGHGIGRMMMEYLRVVAGLRGAREIRLKVYPDNTAAAALYSSLGYIWQDGLENGQMIGVLAIR